MKLVRFIIIFLCFSIFCAWSHAATDEIKQAQIQQVLDSWRARSGIPSASLSILLPDHEYPVTFTSGTKEYASGQKTTGDTLFQAGSITKSFTAMIMLQLESEGKLNLNDSIAAYLPQYSRWQNVTIRQLLNHTSGIFNYTATGSFNHIRKYAPQAQLTPEEMVQMASQHRNYFSPGRGWKYSNTNYVLAGMIIQKVTGMSVVQVMNHYLHNSEKLNLLHTFYIPGIYSNAFISHMAHGYSSDGHDVTSWNMSWASTAGAIVSTSEDLLAWWRGLFQNKILPPQQMAKMTNLVCERSSESCAAGEAMPHLSDSSVGKGYGLGVIQSGFGSSKVGSVWWHNGSTKGYKAVVMWYPKSNIYMALTIDRDPGYLLIPNLPVIRRILSILLSDGNWHIPFSRPKPAHHSYYHHRHSRFHFSHRSHHRYNA